MRFTCLEPGTYSLTETGTPTGYQPNPAVYTVVVTNRNTITIDGTPASEFVVVNVPYPGLTVLKTDDFDAPLANASFELAGAEGSVRLTTSADGTVIFPRVVPGTYTLREAAWPAGYLPDLTPPRTVVVDENAVMTIDTVVTNSATFQNFEATELEARYYFIDNQNEFGMRPPTFVLNLYQNGTKISSEDAPAGSPGFVLFENMRKYDDNDQPNVYSVGADDVAHYGISMIGNTIYFTIEDYDLSGMVVWMGDDPGTRPTEVTVRLLQDGVELENTLVTAAQNWRFTFANLTINNPLGDRYAYTLEEDLVAGYTTSYEGTNIINRFIV